MSRQELKDGSVFPVGILEAGFYMLDVMLEGKTTK